MSNDLQQKIRSHSYSPHPRVEDYLIDQRRRQSIPEAIDITVRERRLSGLSMTGSEPMEEQVDGHERCITPARVDRPDLTCVICFSLAINPFRCAKVEERAVMGIDVSQTYDQVFHLCCYPVSDRLDVTSQRPGVPLSGVPSQRVLPGQSQVSRQQDHHRLRVLYHRLSLQLWPNGQSRSAGQSHVSVAGSGS